MGLGISLIETIVTYLVFGIFMAAQKFATLSSNFRYLVGLVGLSFVVRIFTELSINIIQKK